MRSADVVADGSSRTAVIAGKNRTRIELMQVIIRIKKGI